MHHMSSFLWAPKCYLLKCQTDQIIHDELNSKQKRKRPGPNMPVLKEAQRRKREKKNAMSLSPLAIPNSTGSMHADDVSKPKQPLACGLRE